MVEGPKWCGKTTTSSQQSASRFNLDDPRGGYQNRNLAILDPNEALLGPRPRLIDEWQEAPHLWDAVRFECDQAMGKPGQFILTGSSTPRDDDKPLHSGAGRIGRIRMDTLTLQEMGISTASTCLSDLFSGVAPKGFSRLDVSAISELVCRGGWPSSLNKTTRQSARIAQSYIEAVVNEDMERASGIKHDPDKVRRLIKSLARNESTLASLRTIANDTCAAGESALNAETVSLYLQVLKRLFIVDDIPAWNPALRSPVRIRSSAKRHLIDPSLATAALGATPTKLKDDLKTLGCLFESLVIHDMLVYARAIDATVWHYHDDTDLEADMIVQLESGEWGAFEVKLGNNQEEDAARSLVRLENKMVNRGERPAAVKAIIEGVGAVAHRRDDGVCIIPVDALGI